MIIETPSFSFGSKKPNKKNFFSDQADAKESRSARYALHIFLTDYLTDNFKAVQVLFMMLHPICIN
jgi:hypothetical protein